MIICHLERLTEWCLNGCMNNHHLQATMAQLRRGQKQLCQREEDEGGEEKVGSVKNGALKGPRNDKGRERGGRKDNVKGRKGNNEGCRQKGKRRIRDLSLAFCRWKQLMGSDRYRWEEAWYCMLRNPPPHCIDQTEMTYNDIIAQLNGREVSERKGGGRKDSVVLETDQEMI